MFKAYLNLNNPAKLKIIGSLYVLMTISYWAILPPNFLAPALYVIPLYLTAIAIPWQKSWLAVPFTAILGIIKDYYVNNLYGLALVQKYVIVMIVLIVLFFIGGQLKKAYDDLHAVKEELANLANIDFLTGLGNHRFFHQSLAREMELAQAKHSSLGLILFDVDNFKNFNDTFGHQAGDMLLNKLARIIEHCLRPGDFACRYGGEEFVLILPNISPKIMFEIGDKIRKTIEKTARITISGGCALFPEDALTADQLVKVADNKLYKIKRSCKNQIA